MWWLCAAVALLLTRAPPAAAACAEEQSDIQLDLPDEDVYTCTSHYIPQARQVLPSVASTYKQENPAQVCLDTAIVYTAAIPNSGAHRATWAKYGEYIYCPPQQWVHNLQHGGVAFLYHPCVHPKLKEALSSLARRYIAKHVITPLHTLSRDRPLALAAWCSTLEMSQINRTELLSWLRDNVYIERRYKAGEEGSYQHLLIRPSVMASGDSSIYLRALNYFTNEGFLLRRRRTIKRRRRRLLLPVVQERTVHTISNGTASTTPAGPQTGEFVNRTGILVTANISSLPGPVTPGPRVYLPPETKPEDSKTDLHSRELDGNLQAEMPKLPANNSIPSPGDGTHGFSGLNLSSSLGINANQGASHHAHEKEELPDAASTHVVFPESKVSVSTVRLPTPTPQTQGKSIDHRVLPSEQPSKPECRCQQDATVQLPVKAQRRLGVNQQKKSGVFVSTPRTEEAKWAAASLIFLFVLLAFSVLYTQIYKKFRKSQSLYWTSESHLEHEESVASVIKRRLVQGHSIRKKWTGRKKSPMVLYESLSESSD
ncbi:hypothetical protein GDO78_008847 [Eleutherodactylus coqui]|uniref:Tumor protein p53-inducible protein 13 n=1 Tax=Eleutherodactylus coqui TaxID=57060 RepID=A0A8J6FFT7_ELECQ|nr:hypothetical protein GDO78_008847 [Eleutherodactylus coqui]